MPRLPAFATACVLALFAQKASAQTCTPFTDVAASDPFCSNIQWMHNRAITLGCTATAYCPAQFVRRDQMAAFMNRLGNITFQQGGNAFGGPATLGTTDAQPLDVIVQSERVMRFEPHAKSPNVIGGHRLNSAGAGKSGVVIGGGGSSFQPNIAHTDWTTIAGGVANEAGPGAWSTVGGGEHNVAAGTWSTIAGGVNNLASANLTAIVGGSSNWAGGMNSVVMGHRAFTLPAAEGSFVFADLTSADFASHGPNEFLVAASGGIGLYTSKSGTTYCRIDAGGGSWNCSSSRTVKRDFAAIDTRRMLDQVVALSLTSWRFVGEAPEVRHVGPIAEDFRAAFGLGSDERSIASVDAQGVAFAAIQGLNAKLEAALAARDTEITTLRAELAALRSLVAAGAIVTAR